MNSYLFMGLIEPTTPPLIGDAVALKRLCKQIGMLVFGGNSRMNIGGRMGIASGAYISTNAAAGNGAVEVGIESPYRLPATLMPPTAGATTSGELISAGAGIAAMTTALDDQMTKILTNLDRPIVTAGCGIVAYLGAGVDVSDELDKSIAIPFCNGQQIVIGTAIQGAQQGIYETPFSTAWAFAAFGGEAIESVTVTTVDGAKNIGRGSYTTARLRA